jgi:hypothetical protein
MPPEALLRGLNELQLDTNGQFPPVSLDGAGSVATRRLPSDSVIKRRIAGNTNVSGHSKYFSEADRRS